jgi:flagellar hook-length control protein FliK
LRIPIMAPAITANLLAAVDAPISTPAALPTNSSDPPISSFSNVLTQVQNQTATEQPARATTPSETERVEVEIDSDLLEDISLDDAGVGTEATNLFAASFVAANILLPAALELPTAEPTPSETATAAATRERFTPTQSRVEENRFLKIPGIRVATSSTPEIAQTTSDLTESLDFSRTTPATTATTNLPKPFAVTASATTANTTSELPRVATARPSVLPQVPAPVDPNPTLPAAIPNIGYGNVRPNVTGPTEISGPLAVKAGRGTAVEFTPVASQQPEIANPGEVPVAFDQIIETAQQRAGLPVSEVTPERPETATRPINLDLPAPTVELVDLPPRPPVPTPQPAEAAPAGTPTNVPTQPVASAPSLSNTTRPEPLATIDTAVPNPVAQPTTRVSDTREVGSQSVVSPKANPTPTSDVVPQIVAAPSTDTPQPPADATPDTKSTVSPAVTPTRSTTTQPTNALVSSSTSDTETNRLTPRSLGSISQSEATASTPDRLDTPIVATPFTPPVVLPSTPAATTTTPSAPIHEQLHTEIVTNAKLIETRPGEVEFRMELDPKDLGPVRIRLTATRDELRAEVVVADDAVRKMVENQLPELRQRLESSGVSVSRFEVSTDTSGTSRGRDETNQRPQPEPTFVPPKNAQTPLAQRFQRTTTVRAGSLDVTV